jgi:ubiquinone/menaquinone biosynthesis C-methylase UbiE
MVPAPVRNAVRARLQRRFVRFQYNYLNWRAQESVFRYLNYGYVDLEPHAPMLRLDPQEETNRLSIQLYQHVVESVVLRDKDVLEVGSGRGGGASFLARNFHPRQMVGLDYSGLAVRFCSRMYDIPGLHFQKGNAEKLPFADASFDVVVNVESSHGYSYVQRFFAEVYRVLRPGGHFVFADFRGAAFVPALNRELDESGMILIQKRDITANVVESLDRDSDRKKALISQLVPAYQLQPILNFGAVKGSEIHGKFKNGELQYWSFVLHKPKG